MNLELQTRNGFWSWNGRSELARVCFAGKPVDNQVVGGLEQLRRLPPKDVEPAWLQQVHSASVVNAVPGDNGLGDALVTGEPRLGLAVVTADCVPVLLSTGDEIAAIHAGWRGIAAKIIPTAVMRLRDRHLSGAIAWIGPAIGPCCYEVGGDVADQVSGASSEEIVRAGPRGRPHLDLAAAASFQLRESGIEDIRRVEVCTHCDSRFWSYRRDGAGAGRNTTVIWLA